MASNIYLWFAHLENIFKLELKTFFIFIILIFIFIFFQNI